MLPNKTGELPLFSGDGNHRPARRRNAIKFARDDDAFTLGLQRNPVHVRDRKRIFQQPAVLIGRKAKQMIELALLDATSELVEPMPAADEEKNGARRAREALCCGEDRIE